MDSIQHSGHSNNILEILEKILDKGVVIAGDIKVSLVNVELLTIKIRLIVASVDKAREIGLNWWETDPYLSSRAKEIEARAIQIEERAKEIEEANQRVEQRLALLDQMMDDST